MICVLPTIFCARCFIPRLPDPLLRYHSQGFNLRSLKHLVLDEADRMLSMDFEEELNKVREKINKKGRILKYRQSPIANRCLLLLCLPPSPVLPRRM